MSNRAMWVVIPGALSCLCLAAGATEPLRPRGAAPLALTVPVLLAAGVLALRTNTAVGRTRRDLGDYDLKGVPFAAAGLLLNPVLVLVIAMMCDVVVTPKSAVPRSRWCWVTASIAAGTATCCGLVFRLVAPRGLSEPIVHQSQLRLAAALTLAILVALVLFEAVSAAAQKVLTGSCDRVWLHQSAPLFLLSVAQVALGLLVAVAWADAPALLVLCAALYCGLWVAIGVFRTEIERDQDAKTGLLNAAAFRAAAEREIARAARSAEHVCLLVVDVDRLKNLNAMLGHVGADGVLLNIAGTLAEQSRTYDLVGRFGGDEFVLLLPSTELEAAAAIAERIRCAVEAKATRDGRLPHLGTVSLGVCQRGADECYDDLMRAADALVYEAKNAGGNLVSVRPMPHVPHQRTPTSPTAAAQASDYRGARRPG